MKLLKPVETLKIAILSWEYPPHFDGGLGRHVGDLAPALAKQGLEIHVFTRQVRQEPLVERPAPNLIIHRVSTPSPAEDDTIYQRAEQVNPLLEHAVNAVWQEVGGFNLIHAHDWLVTFAALSLQATHQCTLLATIHATERGRWRNNELPNDLARSINQAEDDLANHADHLIACSHYMIQELHDFFEVPTDKITVIPNGINITTAFNFSPAALLRFRAKHADINQPIIFSVGRLVYEKGYKVLVGAMPHVLESVPHAKLILAGKGPLQAELEADIEHFDLQNNVNLVGFITDAERDMFLSVAACAIFPSLYEPFGIVALEAMVAHCPVVVSKTGGLAEVVEHQTTGLHIYPNDSHSTAWGITEMLQKPQQATQYAQAARYSVTQNFNWQNIARQTKKLYQTCLTPT